MSKNNWAGGSGWKAISDPTKKLSGRVLVATAGTTQFAEDYLLTLAGTTTAFNVDHYGIQLSYAFPSGVSETTFNSGMLGLISRATGLTNTPIVADNCYIGRINARDTVAEIIRRNNGEETMLASSILPTSTYSFGVLHTMRFNTYGDNPVNLQFLVDDTTLVTVGDSSTSALTTGYAGIQANGGTAYCDNFTILEYDSGGSAPYSGWQPNSAFTSNQLIAWYKADTGITYDNSTTKTIANWNDQSGNSFNLVKTTGAEFATGTPPKQVTNDGITSIRFDNTQHNILKGVYGSKLALQTTNKGICWAALVKVYKEPIGDLVTGNIGEDQTIGSMFSVGRNYGFQFFDDPTSSNALKTIRFRSGTSSVFSSGVTSYSVGDYAIYVFNANGDTVVAGTTDRGWFYNGSQVATYSNSAPSGVDQGVSPNILVGRLATQDQALENYAYGTFDIVEMQLYADTLLGASRTKIEGYFAWKYGLVSLLPSNHPYKNVEPT